MYSLPIVLTIAGSDPSGGAGIQADLKTFSAHHCYAYSVITNITAQSNSTYYSTFPLPPSIILDQIKAVMEEQVPKVIKIGMIYHPTTALTIASVLKEIESEWIILDPMIKSSSGEWLLTREAFQVLREELIPLSHIITPNYHEALELMGCSQSIPLSVETFKRLQFNPEQIIILTNGDSKEEEITDYLFLPENNEIHQFTHPRVISKHLHGTGCTFSSALAANLALGQSIKNALMGAITYTSEAIQNGNEIEWKAAKGPLHHFYKLWR